MKLSFTQAELEALAGAGEEMIEMVSKGRRWQNEPPETLRALKTATAKMLKKLP